MAECLENVYAKAMFELCREQGCCDEVYRELEQCEVVFRDNEDFLSILSSPLISLSDRIDVLEKVFNSRVSGIVLDFFCVVTEKGRARFLPSICTEFKRLYFKDRNILEVKVVTAVPLSSALSMKLKEKLEKTLNKKIIMHESTDRGLLGGIIVRYENSEIDSSVRGRLGKLKLQINSVIA